MAVQSPAQTSSSNPHRVVFMGTPEFAVPTLELLLATEDVVGVFTQPDRPAGRGRRVRPSPVKVVAEEHGVPVFQPRSLKRDPGAVARLVELAPEVVVVAAYGLILPSEALQAAPGGVLNVHASLLPRWRGAAPVAYTLLAGDSETGVTIMLMDEGLDTGPILAQRRTAVGPEETTGSLTRRLAVLGAELLGEVLPAWLGGEITPQPQDEAAATHAPRLKREDGWLDWTADAQELARRVRAMNPWPGAYTEFQGQPLKVHAAVAMDPPPGAADLPPGTVVGVDREVAVVTGRGWLRLEAVQPAGRRAMSAAEFVRGRQHFIGSQLGTVERSSGCD